MSLFSHPNRGRRWIPPAADRRWTLPELEPEPEPQPEPAPEPKVIMSICMWCDFCQRPYPDSDPDSTAMTVPVPKVENGIKVGVAYTVERHKCGDCMREERRTADRRRAISQGEHDAEKTAHAALRDAWGNGE